MPPPYRGAFSFERRVPEPSDPHAQRRAATALPELEGIALARRLPAAELEGAPLVRSVWTAAAAAPHEHPHELANPERWQPRRLGASGQG